MIINIKGDYWSSINIYQLLIWQFSSLNPSDGMHHHQSKGYDETLTDVLKIQKSEVETPRFPFIKCYFQSLDIPYSFKI